MWPSQFGPGGKMASAKPLSNSACWMWGAHRVLCSQALAQLWLLLSLLLSVVLRLLWFYFFVSYSSYSSYSLALCWFVTLSV